MAKPVWAGALRLEPFAPDEDPHAAPGAYKGPGAFAPWTLRRAGQNMVAIYAFGLIFLVFVFVGIGDGATSTWDLVARIAAVVSIGVAYLFAAWMCDTPLWVRWTYIVGFVGLLASTSPFMGWNFVNYGIYVCILMATLVPWRQSRLSILIWGLMIVGVSLLVHDWVPVSIGLTGIAIGWATAGGIEAGRISRKLSRAEQRVSLLSVAAERERIGRDLHDILGHSLTAISIKSGLATRLVDSDPTAAKAEIADIEAIARQALADVRATASGYREVRVATEIASARSVLLAAGIEARVPSAIEPLPAQASELFGYVIREGVTNVVRHSEATTCTITLSATGVSVADDGKGCRSGSTGGGSGLAGLAARLEAAGGRVVVEQAPGGGTVVRAEYEPGGAGSSPVESEVQEPVPARVVPA